MANDFIFNETISPIGKEFFDLYRNQWVNPAKDQQLTITVTEKLMPGMGTTLIVTIGDQRIYSTFLRPNREKIEAAAEDALKASTLYCLKIQSIQKQLENEDKSGTGVF